ncbi:MAG: hypothetical protein AAF968_11735, partial [Pseudomonadota bacterium]
MGKSFASFLRFWAVAARRNSSFAPHGPRDRSRPAGSRRLQESTAILRGDFEHENSRIRAAFVRALYVREQQALAKQR